MDEKKSFFKGAMFGILSTIIIVSVILGGAFYYGIIEAGNNDQKKQASGLAAELSDKMERIEMILDRNYLDEYDQEQLENGVRCLHVHKRIHMLFQFKKICMFI